MIFFSRVFPFDFGYTLCKYAKLCPTVAIFCLRVYRKFEVRLNWLKWWIFVYNENRTLKYKNDETYQLDAKIMIYYHK